MKNFSLAAIACLVSLTFCSGAYADSFTQFALNGVEMTSGLTATGVVLIDVTTGIVVSEDVTYNGDLFSLDGVSGNTLHNSYSNFNDAAGDTFQISVPPLTLVGYSGGPLCSSEAVRCIDEVNPNIQHAGGFIPLGGGPVDFITEGSLVPTPEPSSLMLLATGLLGVVGAGYRRTRGIA